MLLIIYLLLIFNFSSVLLSISSFGKICFLNIDVSFFDQFACIKMCVTGCMFNNVSLVYYYIDIIKSIRLIQLIFFILR